MASRKRETQRGFSELEASGTVPDIPRAPAVPDVADATGTIPDVPRAPVDVAVTPAGRPSIPVAAPGAPPSDVELEEIHERGTPSLLGGGWRAVEVWTQNRIYALDGSMMCRQVQDRASSKLVGDHPALGSRLVGGQLRDGEGRIVKVAHPFPRRGMAAVFATGLGTRLRVSETSPVTRVVVRQRTVEVGADGAPPWDALV
ncbi:MAG: hypothetical protein KF901_24350 [Myxococcales bacterium]|nr:hypothetical protein [Myxococcales bacterium]